MKLRSLFAIILLVSIFLISCSVRVDDPVVPTSPTVTPSQSTSYDEPPKALYFDCLADLEELRGALKLSDKSLIAYLEEKRFDQNGLSNRSETEAFFKLIDTVPIFDLTAHGLMLTTIYYYYDDMVLLLSYRGEDDSLRLRYLLNTDFKNNDIFIDEEITKNYKLGSYKLDMYPNTKHDTVYTAYGLMDIGTYYVRVAYRNDKTVYPIFLENGNVTTTTLKELGKKVK